MYGDGFLKLLKRYWLPLLALFYAEEGKAKLALFFIYGAEVGFGELVVLFVLGLPLMRALPKTKFFPELKAKLDNA